jgi:SAM-dependent methyltransferase
MTRYDAAWWAEHATEYARGFVPKPGHAAQEEALVEAVRSADARTPIRSVIEVGCGFGRVSAVLHETLAPDLYLATDAEPAMLDAARIYLFEIPVVLAEFSLDDEPDQGPADLVVAVEVLMHRPPDVIAVDIAKLCAMSGAWVLTADWYGDTSRREAEGCWQHDYPALFGAHGIVGQIPVEGARQSVFLTRVEANDGSPD